MEYSEILKDLRRETYSVRNRLQSIIHDARFVSQFSAFPLVANERCGLWYIKPEDISESAYFKSTDGHADQWKFSFRRLNFHLLPMLGKHGTIVLVDSTRRGKLMPDALLKTVPIWCAVINYVMFEGEEVDEYSQLQNDNWLLTPREMVSESEHFKMVKMIPEHARELLKLGLTLKADLMSRLGGTRKPILPQWVYPGKEKVEKLDAYSICCLTASSKAAPGERVLGWSANFPYIQGAADDHELWATNDVCGGKLDPALFWDHIYLEPSEEVRVVDMATGDISGWLSDFEFVSRINGIYDQVKKSDKAIELDVTQLGSTGIYIGKIDQDIALSIIKDEFPSVGGVFVFSEKFKVLAESDTDSNPVRHHFPVEASKKGAKKLREVLPQVLATDLPSSVLLLCDSGKDISVGVAVCLLCKHYTTNWEQTAQPPHVNKDVVKQHLSKISDYRKTNPSRNTLQSLNVTLMK